MRKFVGTLKPEKAVSDLKALFVDVERTRLLILIDNEHSLASIQTDADVTDLFFESVLNGVKLNEQ